MLGCAFGMVVEIVRDILNCGDCVYAAWSCGDFVGHFGLYCKEISGKVLYFL
jgi:hypothetical protein